MRSRPKHLTFQRSSGPPDAGVGSSAARRSSHIGSAPSAAWAEAAGRDSARSAETAPNQKSICWRSVPRRSNWAGSQCGLATIPEGVRKALCPRSATSNCSSISRRRLYSETAASGALATIVSITPSQFSKLAAAELVSSPQLMSTTSRVRARSSGAAFSSHSVRRRSISGNEIGTRWKPRTGKARPSTSRDPESFFSALVAEATARSSVSTRRNRSRPSGAAAATQSASMDLCRFDRNARLRMRFRLFDPRDRSNDRAMNDMESRAWKCQSRKHKCFPHGYCRTGDFTAI